MNSIITEDGCGGVTVEVDHGHDNYPVDSVRLDVEDRNILWVHCPAPGCGWHSVPVPAGYWERLS